MTVTAFDHAVSHQFEKCSEILDQRSRCLNDLVALYPARISKETLSLYLFNLSEIDRKITEMLTEHKTAMQNTLSNFGNLKEYLKF